jgi:hypothetical protein
MAILVIGPMARIVTSCGYFESENPPRPLVKASYESRTRLEVGQGRQDQVAVPNMRQHNRWHAGKGIFPKGIPYSRAREGIENPGGFLPDALRRDAQQLLSNRRLLDHATHFLSGS